MFSWFRHKKAEASHATGAIPTQKAAPEAPPLAQKPKPDAPVPNPGIAVRGDVQFTRGRERWSESFDAVTIVTEVLQTLGHDVSPDENSATCSDPPCLIRPQLVEFQPLDGGGVRTVTTVEVDLPSLDARGIFEYQHSTGANMQDSIRKGLEQWAKVDLVPLIDAMRDKPKECTLMVMEFPTADGEPKHKRRIVLGPVAHLQQNPPKQQVSEEHPFCPCCLLTHTFKAFEAQLKDAGVHAIRLFAMRDEHGQPAADCRINGQEYEPGKAALREYVRQWPNAGVEFRKQYVVVHSLSSESTGNC